VFVLDGGDRLGDVRSTNRLGTHLREAEVDNLALRDQLLDGPATSSMGT
jgi:hypothetical protein